MNRLVKSLLRLLGLDFIDVALLIILFAFYGFFLFSLDLLLTALFMFVKTKVISDFFLPLVFLDKNRGSNLGTGLNLVKIHFKRKNV